MDNEQMRMLVWTGLLWLALHAPVAAQDLVHQAGQQNALARLLSVRATEPTVGKCDRGVKDRCFRIFIELAPRDDREIGLASHGNGPTSTAYAASGAQCKGHPIGGVNRGAHDALRNQWNVNRLTFADKNKPAVATMEFICDNVIITNEEVTVQVIFDIYVNARENGQGRYIFNRVRLNGQ